MQTIVHPLPNYNKPSFSPDTVASISTKVSIDLKNLLSFQLVPVENAKNVLLTADYTVINRT